VRKANFVPTFLCLLFHSLFSHMLGPIQTLTMVMCFCSACVYSKSSIVLGLAITVPLIVASLSVSLPIWVHNGYRFYLPPAWEHSANGACETQARHGKSKEVSYTE